MAVARADELQRREWGSNHKGVSGARTVTTLVPVNYLFAWHCLKPKEPLSGWSRVRRVCGGRRVCVAVCCVKAQRGVSTFGSLAHLGRAWIPVAITNRLYNAPPRRRATSGAYPLTHRPVNREYMYGSSLSLQLEVRGSGCVSALRLVLRSPVVPRATSVHRARPSVPVVRL